MCIHFLILTVCNTAMTLEVQLSLGESDFISSEWICGNESGEFCVKVLVLSLRFSLLMSIMTIPVSVPSKALEHNLASPSLPTPVIFVNF